MNKVLHERSSHTRLKGSVKIPPRSIKVPLEMIKTPVKASSNVCDGARKGLRVWPLVIFAYVILEPDYFELVCIVSCPGHFFVCVPSLPPLSVPFTHYRYLIPFNQMQTNLL